MADILVELLAQQLVLIFQLEIFLRHPGVLRLQRGDSGTQFLKLFEQCRVGHASLTRPQNFCSKSVEIFINVDTNLFSTALPARESTH